MKLYTHRRETVRSVMAAAWESSENDQSRREPSTLITGKLKRGPRTHSSHAVCNLLFV